MNTKSAWAMFSAGAILLSAAGLGGCTAEVEPVAPANAVADDVRDSEVEAAPYVIYEGRRVHYLRGHWYFRNGNHYSYYRDEPPGLRGQRPR